MLETDDMELDLLQRRAARSGFYVNKHMGWEPDRGNGDLYLSYRRRSKDEKCPWLMKFQTADQLHVVLGKIEQGDAIERATR